MSGRRLVALDLDGRRVVVVGGGRVGTRRAFDLLDHGARVTVIAPSVTPQLRAAHEARRLVVDERTYAGPADLVGAWFVHTATGDRGIDARVAADAETARIWCVDAGDGARSAAHLPAATTLDTPDGPVTLGVHTSGDPRRAVAVRADLAHRLTTGGADLRRRRARPGAGWAALVGGGPGAEGLVTARGLTLLACADVVLVDRLAPRGPLRTLHPDVTVTVLADGDDGAAELVAQARAGRAVVRLARGDVGEAGEVLRASCAAQQVALEVVPGVAAPTPARVVGHAVGHTGGHADGADVGPAVAPMVDPAAAPRVGPAVVPATGSRGPVAQPEVATSTTSASCPPAAASLASPVTSGQPKASASAT